MDNSTIVINVFLQETQNEYTRNDLILIIVGGKQCFFDGFSQNYSHTRLHVPSPGTNYLFAVPVQVWQWRQYKGGRYGDANVAKRLAVDLKLFYNKTLKTILFRR